MANGKWKMANVNAGQPQHTAFPFAIFHLPFSIRNHA
jgi:hypothetical protein